MNKQGYQPDFNGLGIAPAVLKIINDLGFKYPTPIQRQAIPVALEGKDVIGVAETGTGKTLAFGIPTIERVLQSKGQALVVLPTRELALQVDAELFKLGGKLGVRTAILIGGASMNPQITAIRRRPGVVIGTPGRIIDHLERRTLNLSRVGTLILDEADRMLDMGFAPQLQRILKEVPRERQTMLFSATMPDEIVRIAAGYMKLPVRVEVALPGKPAERVAQEIIFVQKDSKIRLLEKLLVEHRGPVLVFTRMKYGAKRIAHAVRGMGETAAELHSNRSLNQRREALEGFKKGVYRVLVATDIAARGIDVTGIELVVNFDLPTSPEDYVHRIGRTARAGRSGKAISFATPGESRDVRDIERLIRSAIPVRPLPSDLPPARAVMPPPEKEMPHRFGEKRYANARPHRGSPRGFRREFSPAASVAANKPTSVRRGTGSLAEIASPEHHRPFLRPGGGPVPYGRSRFGAKKFSGKNKFGGNQRGPRKKY